MTADVAKRVRKGALQPNLDCLPSPEVNKLLKLMISETSDAREVEAGWRRLGIIEHEKCTGRKLEIS